VQRRAFLVGLMSGAVCLPRVTSALTGGVEVTGLFSSPAQPLIDLNSGSSLFDPFEPDEPAADQGEVVTRAPQVTTDGDDAVLALWNANTDEHIRLRPVSSTGLDYSELDRANHFMRDWRRNEVKAVDTSLIVGLLEVQQRARRKGFTGELRFLSGYRSPQTNEMLRRKTKGVARYSMHLEAKAIDFSLPGVSIRDTLQIAKDLGIGGVGGYSSFVHIDSGRRRYWGIA